MEADLASRRARREKKRRATRIRMIAEAVIVLTLLTAVVWALVSAISGPRDKTPPQIAGVRDITVYQGDAVSYRSGITVTDDLDPAPVLNVDTAAADLSVPGTYTVIYVAEDAAGNRSEKTATVTVLVKPVSYVELAQIEGAVGEVLQQILRDDMTPEECVRAIYAWAQENIGYAGHSDRTDYRQTAYTVLAEREGDCYGYFAVTKLMFESLGIPNIDVQKVRNFPEDSDHFWSLVSVDGGQTYYHFDATPRIGDGDEFCLVTDAFLDSYSREHENSHNRDTSLYPKTP